MLPYSKETQESILNYLLEHASTHNETFSTTMSKLLNISDQAFNLNANYLSSIGFITIKKPAQGELYELTITAFGIRYLHPELFVL